jgi:hypothetical protein
MSSEQPYPGYPKTLMVQTTVQIFGEFVEESPTGDEYLTLHFSPSSAPRKRRWGNNGLSADFLGDYFAAFFPGDVVPDSKISQKDTVKGAVSYIANELLENAVKYSDEDASLPITISLYLYDQQLVFQVINYANADRVEKYQLFIQAMLSADIDEFYTQQMEKAALGEGSNMGLLTMINDYSAHFGWKFSPSEVDPAVIQVNVLVHLNV